LGDTVSLAKHFKPPSSGAAPRVAPDVKSMPAVISGAGVVMVDTAMTGVVARMSRSTAVGTSIV
jgi:hypothetical protein